MEDEVEQFKKKLNKTKYSRINAYKRCLAWNNFFKIISCVYNLAVISLSILTLIPTIFQQNQTIISALLIIAAICTFALDLFLNTVSYSSKAEQYKSSYNELEALNTKLEEGCTSKGLKSIKEAYDTLIKNSINHAEQDYCKYVYEHKDVYDSSYYKAIKKKYIMFKVQDFMVKCVFSFMVYLVIFLFKIIIATLYRLALLLFGEKND